MKTLRTRNARGQGAHLADEIVNGALAIIEREGGTDGVTLRAVAREVGIAAPSIYAHFADREAILRAVVERVFEELTEAVLAAVEGREERPLDRLVAGCEAYVEFGMSHPRRYQAVFAKEIPEGGELESRPDGPTVTICTVAGETALLVGGEAFAVLVDAVQTCIDQGLAPGPDAFEVATSIWVGMHGAVSLWSTAGSFPWPSRPAFLRRLVLGLAAAPTAPTTPRPLEV